MTGGDLGEGLVYGQSFLPVVERFPTGSASWTAGVVVRTVNTSNGSHSDSRARTQLGRARHDRFAVLALNSLSYLELWHAAFLGGGVINPLNLRLAPKELAYILADSGTKVCFADPSSPGWSTPCESEAGIEQVVLVGAGDVPHDIAYEELCGRGAPLPAEPDEADPVALMYTGGTTGLPKGSCSNTAPRCSTCTTCASCIHSTTIRVPAPDADVSRGLDGRRLGPPAPGASRPSCPRSNPARCSTPSNATGHDDGHGADDDRSDADASRLRSARLRSLRLLGYGASPMPLATLERLRAELPRSTSFRATG